MHTSRSGHAYVYMRARARRAHALRGVTRCARSAFVHAPDDWRASWINAFIEADDLSILSAHGILTYESSDLAVFSSDKDFFFHTAETACGSIIETCVRRSKTG